VQTVARRVVGVFVVACASAGGTELESVQRVTGNIVSSQMRFLLKPDDNGAEYQCNATNDATTEALVATVKLSVQCKYAAANTVLLVLPLCGRMLTPL